jgi:hypothetical protein
LARAGAGDIAAQVFECVVLIEGAAHFGMQAKAVLVDTAFFEDAVVASAAEAMGCR